jgi:hypothetical protein
MTSDPKGRRFFLPVYRLQGAGYNEGSFGRNARTPPGNSYFFGRATADHSPTAQGDLLAPGASSPSRAFLKEPDMKNQLTSTLAGVPSEQLKQAVLDTVYDVKYLRVLTGYKLLAAVHGTTNVGIYVVDGNFGREHYKLAIEEAKAAGINASRVYAYAQTATYSGQSICFSKFEEIGLKQPIVPAQVAAESSIHPDASKPIVTLKCTCCGSRFQGRQFSGQDTGWGLGNCCVAYCSKVENMARNYGVDGVHYNLPQPDQTRQVEGDRLFSGIYPTGIVYADRAREVNGDYARLAYLNFDTLTLQVEHNCPADLRQRIEADAAEIQAMRGEQYRISTSNQTVLLGAAAA